MLSPVTTAAKNCSCNTKKHTGLHARSTRPNRSLNRSLNGMYERFKKIRFVAFTNFSVLKISSCPVQVMQRLEKHLFDFSWLQHMLCCNNIVCSYLVNHENAQCSVCFWMFYGSTCICSIDTFPPRDNKNSLPITHTHTQLLQRTLLFTYSFPGDLP